MNALEKYESMDAPTAENPRQVLFVDDEQNIRRALKRALQAEPYRIHLAGGGDEALALLERETIQVVVTDITMPGMDGLTLLEEISRRYPDTMRMVLSGRSGTATIIDAVNAGKIYRYILKPWNDDDLKINVRHALALHGLQSERNRMTALLQEHNQGRIDLHSEKGQGSTFRVYLPATHPAPPKSHTPIHEKGNTP